jgi:peptidoglycan/LPS O-acetylase OafA/YrhL
MMQAFPPGFCRHAGVGALVAFFIVGLTNASLPMPGATVERLVRYLAGTTFGLYLLHDPLLIFFGTVIPGAADRPVRRILLFGLTLGGSILIAHLIERQKGAFRRALHFGLDGLRGRPLRPAFERERLLDRGKISTTGEDPYRTGSA